MNNFIYKSSKKHIGCWLEEKSVFDSATVLSTYASRLSCVSSSFSHDLRVVDLTLQKIDNDAMEWI